MKRLKSGLALIMAVSVMFSGVISSFAQETDSKEIIYKTAERLIGLAMKDPYIQLNNGSYAISESVPCYLLSNGDISAFVEAEYYIVYGDDKPIGIFSVNAANTDSPTYIFGQDFVNKLDESVLRSRQNYSFIITENQIFTLVNGEAKELVKYDLASVSNDSNTYSIGSIDEYTPSEVLNSIDQIENLKTTDSSVKQALNPRSTRDFVTVVGNIPQYTQPPKSNYCWAASAWCVGEYLNSKDYTVPYLVDFTGKGFGTGGGMNEQVKILNEKYDLNAQKIQGTFERGDISFQIDIDEPFILNCYNSSSTLGHSVTCYGCEDDPEPVDIAVMDSLVSSGSSNLRWMTNYGNGQYSITNGNTTYTWTTTISPTFHGYYD